MSNKTLRILIADEQHFHRMKIERVLNQLGYFRIAPVHCVEELLTLVEYGCEPFDLVMISASLTAAVDFDLPAFCGDNQQIRHGFIYDDPQARLAQVPAGYRHKLQASQERMPDLERVWQLMEWVDPRSNTSQAPRLSWLPDACRSHGG